MGEEDSGFAGGMGGCGHVCGLLTDMAMDRVCAHVCGPSKRVLARKGLGIKDADFFQNP